MKRKAETEPEEKKPVKKRSKTSLTDEEAKSRFGKGLFDPAVLGGHTAEYSSSSPYKHGVISGLIDDALLRAVRDEIRANVSFTPKETDIYKIHQSGDLANLDGLDDDALSKLPSLLALRDAMYSDAFRHYVSRITGCGPLSGRKTDMAINVYTPGCYLLCHDDVIGSRRVSYILYLTDPDQPWRPEWGGALRLYPVTERRGKGGELAKTPTPDAAKTIPPAWNQLSYFAVQPGESFHDVEEVYHADSAAQLEADGGRVRMAISGWFHIPQVGEEGWVEGAEEKAARNSGLAQLQGNPDQYDQPQPRLVAIELGDSQETTATSTSTTTTTTISTTSSSSSSSQAAVGFDEADLEFLLKYLSPTYLTPDTLERIAEHFDQSSSITLPDILTPKFAARLRAYVLAQEAAPLPDDSVEIEKPGPWRVARPPHKHRFLYLQPGDGSGAEEDEDGKEALDESPVQELLERLLPSRPFRAWLQMATSSVIESHDLVARRFRRGKDYTLATGHEGKPRLELNIGFTPTGGWGDDGDEEGGEGGEAAEAARSNGVGVNGKGKGKGKATAAEDDDAADRSEPDAAEVGGHEVYMAGDEDGGNDDAAIYRSGGADDDDNILFFQAAAWNKMTIVVRDSGTLRFVKYVSRTARGDRWDIAGTFEIEEEQEEDEDANGQVLIDSSEEEFRGFSDSDDSDSD